MNEKLPILIIVALLLGSLLFLSGCVVVTRAQLEGKLPRIDAQELTVTASTIYGVSGTLTEKEVKWNGDSKTVGSSELRITSPVGAYHRVIKGAATTAARPAAPIEAAPASPAPAPVAPSIP